MSSTNSLPDEMQGEQRPRIESIPPYTSTSGREAVELAAMAGLFLDPWQEHVLVNALGERPDGKWAAFEVGLVVSRQNGKGSLLEARELAGLFLLNERLIVHSAHEFATSLEAFTRLSNLIDETPDFRRRVKRVSHAHGEEGIELKTGQRIRFRTRTKRGGRGFTADCIILDEAMKIPESAHGALLPTLSARPNPQLWYTGSAVDQEYEEHGVVLARIRERGLAGGDPSLAYFEWSADVPFANLTPDIANDPKLWAQANPALGIRISEEHVGNEYASTRGGRTFVVERLGVGDWPRTDLANVLIISPESWAECVDEHSTPGDPVVFAVDVPPDRSSAVICAAGERPDGLPHVEVCEMRRGISWVPDRLAELVQRHHATAVCLDAYGPVKSIIPDLEQRNLPLITLATGDVVQACGMFYDAVVDTGDLRHRGEEALTAAVMGAATTPLGDAWKWSRKSSSVDISPLYGTTLALWGLLTIPKATPDVYDLNEVVEQMRQHQEV